MNDRKYEQTQRASSGGIGFCGLLTIVFITLKLIGYISWSWLWVLAPLWIPLAIFTVIFAIAMVIVLIAAIVTSKS